MNIPSLEHLTHMTIITGNNSENLMVLKKYITDQGIATEGNPECMFFEYEQLLMDDVMLIIDLAQKRATAPVRIITIATYRIDHRVQNKLLKTFEEPYQGTYFFLLVPQADQLLDTVRSRALIIQGDQALGTIRLDAQEFLQKNMNERFELVELWTKNKNTDNNLLKSEIQTFCNTIETLLWNNNNRDQELFSDLHMVRNYVIIRGASHRVLLDFLAMRCPVLK